MQIKREFLMVDNEYKFLLRIDGVISQEIKLQVGCLQVLLKE